MHTPDRKTAIHQRVVLQLKIFVNNLRVAIFNGYTITIHQHLDLSRLLNTLISSVTRSLMQFYLLHDNVTGEDRRPLGVYTTI